MTKIINKQLLNVMNKPNEKELEADYQNLLEAIGIFMRSERTNLGYKDADDFATMVDTDGASIRKYENGKTGITLKTFHKIYRRLGKTNEEIFTSLIIKSNQPHEIEETASFKLSREQEHQVRHQVESALSNLSEQPTSDQLDKIYKLLIICIQYRKKSEIVTKLELSSKTRSLEKALSITLEAGWINMRYPEQPTRRDQMYITTEKGRKILKVV